MTKKSKNSRNFERYKKTQKWWKSPNTQEISKNLSKNPTTQEISKNISKSLKTQEISKNLSKSLKTQEISRIFEKRFGIVENTKNVQK